MKFSHTLQHGWTVRTYAKWKKPNTAWFYLYESYHINEINLTDAESKMVVAGGWERGEWRVAIQ